MHWDHEPLAATRRTESAEKSDALQTLRVVRRRPAVAKRLECVRLQRRLPKPGYDSMTGPVQGMIEVTQSEVLINDINPCQSRHSSSRHNQCSIAPARFR